MLLPRYRIRILLAGLCLLLAGGFVHAAPNSAATPTKGTGGSISAGPTLKSPANGVTVADSTVSLCWTPSQNPEKSPLHYRLDIDTEADFESSATRTYTIDAQGRQVIHAGLGVLALLLAGMSWRRFGRQGKALLLFLGGAALLGAGLFSIFGGAPGSGEDLATISCMVDGLAAGHTYYWRVTAIDDRTLAATTSVTWHFSVR